MTLQAGIRTKLLVIAALSAVILAAAIAAAVEEQNAATAEISRSAQEAANGVANAGEIASETGRDAAQVLAASSATAERSHHIQQAVEEFLASVREG